MNIKCSKCGRPILAATTFHTAKIELCLDCSIEALNVLKQEIPSVTNFINKWCAKKD